MDLAYEKYFESQMQDDAGLTTYTVLTADQEIFDLLLDFIPEDLEGRLRTDAIYFLFSNLYFMAILPISSVAYEGNIAEMISENSDAIENDVIFVLETANAIAEERGADEISSTSCAIALGRTADELKLGSSQIWGPE